MQQLLLMRSPARRGALSRVERHTPSAHAQPHLQRFVTRLIVCMDHWHEESVLITIIWGLHRLYFQSPIWMGFKDSNNVQRTPPPHGSPLLEHRVIREQRAPDTLKPFQSLHHLLYMPACFRALPCLLPPHRLLQGLYSGQGHVNLQQSPFCLSSTFSLLQNALRL